MTWHERAFHQRALHQCSLSRNPDTHSAFLSPRCSMGTLVVRAGADEVGCARREARPAGENRRLPLVSASIPRPSSSTSALNRSMRRSLADNGVGGAIKTPDKQMCPHRQSSQPCTSYSTRSSAQWARCLSVSRSPALIRAPPQIQGRTTLDHPQITSHASGWTSSNNRENARARTPAASSYVCSPAWITSMCSSPSVARAA